MAIVVETVSSLGSGSGTGVTITKPSGVAVGDLLVAILSAYRADNGIFSDTFDTLSGWTSAVGGNYDSDIAHSVQYRVATSADVSASNYTFATGSTGEHRGVILRCSGNNTVDGGLGTTDTENDTGGAFSLQGALTAYTPPEDGALVIMQVGGVDSLASALTVTSYTASGVSFTEAYDQSALSSSATVVGAAYGIQTTSAELATYSAGFSRETDDQYGQLVVFNPPIDATSSNTLTTTNVAVFTQTGTCDTTGSTLLTATTTETFGQSGNANTPTQWTNETQVSTTWTNEQKL